MSAKFKDPMVWLRSLFAAGIGGGCSAGAAWMGLSAAKMAGLDVPSLNFKALGIILLSSGLIHIFTYLAKSPLPEIIVTEETTMVRKTVPGLATVTTETQKTSVTTNDPQSGPKA